jgi:chemotaxis regulatin CheY-phosphate phosphatase CheZ
MATLGNLVVGLNLNALGFTRGLAQVQSATNSIAKGKLLQGSGGLGGFEASLTGSLVKANLLISAMRQLGSLAAKAVVSAADAEMTKLTLEVLSGNQGLGISLFKELEKIAQETTLTLADTTAAAKQLLVSFDVSQIPYLVKMLGNISSGMDNVSLQEMAFLLQTSHEEGKLLQRDLRQFTTRGIPVNKELQDVLGLFGPDAGSRLNEMITAGQVKFSHLFQALDKLSNKWNMLDVQGQTLTGRWNQFMDSFMFILRDVGEMLVEAFDAKAWLLYAAEKLREFRDDLWKIKPVIMEIGAVFKSMFRAIGEILSENMKLINNMFSLLGAKAVSFGDMIMAMVVAVKFFFDNWKDVSLMFGFWFAAWIFRLGDRAKWLFIDVMPAYLTWLLTAIEDFTVFAGKLFEDFFANIGTNAGAMFDWMAGGFQGPMPDLVSQMAGQDFQFPAAPNIPGFQESQLTQDMQKEFELLKSLLGPQFEGLLQGAFEAWDAFKQSLTPALPGMAPWEQNGGKGGEGVGEGALMQGTQGAWDAIMKAMKEDPVVNAIRVQTRQQRLHEDRQMRALNKIAEQKANILVAFPNGGGP